MCADFKSGKGVKKTVFKLSQRNSIFFIFFKQVKPDKQERMTIQVKHCEE